MPRRPPRSWLADRLRSAAGRAERLAGLIDHESTVSGRAAHHADPAAPGAEPGRLPAPPPAPGPDDSTVRAAPAPAAATDAPVRRPGQPPEHWLRLVATHAPGLLHDLPLGPGPVPGVAPAGPSPGAPDAAVPPGGDHGAAVALAGRNADRRNPAAEARAELPRSGGRRTEAPDTNRGATPRTGPAGPASRTGAAEGAPPPGRALPEPGPAADATPADATGGDAPAGGLAGADAVTIRPAAPARSRGAVPAPPVPPWPGNHRPAASFALRQPPQHPPSDGRAAGASATSARRAPASGAAEPGNAARPVAWSEAEQRESRAPSFPALRFARPAAEAPPPRPATAHTGAARVPVDPARPLVLAPPVRATLPQPGGVRPQADATASGSAAVPSGTPPPPRAATAIPPWPALPDPTTTGGRSRSEPRIGGDPGPEPTGGRDPWPRLPDDRALWTPAGDALDHGHLRRLDREQAGA